jgi:hypothetical protein
MIEVMSSPALSAPARLLSAAHVARKLESCHRIERGTSI